MENQNKHKIVILGAGFAGLYAARKLSRANVEITIVDRSNHHLFQPLLYQVATGALSPGDIASPIRGVLHKYKNIRVVKERAKGIDPANKKLILENNILEYDSLIIAAGMKNFYFGKDHWEKQTSGLKSLTEAVEIRRKVLNAFEAAESASEEDKRRSHMTLAVIGAGPTGVETAGAIAELAHHTLENDFRNFDPRKSRILLIEGGPRVLPALHEKLSERAKRDLEKLGIEVLTNTMVKEIEGDKISLTSSSGDETLVASTVIWAAGIRAENFSSVLHDATGVELDRFDRVIVQGDLSVPQYEDIYVAGDMAAVKHPKEGTVPMVAPAAIQEGKYLAKLIKRKLKGKSMKDFSYFDKGNLAVIGRNKAVVEVAGLKFGGFFAWLIWIFIHIAFLIGFDNKLLVLIQWSWTYFTKKRGARLIIDK